MTVPGCGGEGSEVEPDSEVQREPPAVAWGWPGSPPRGALNPWGVPWSPSVLEAVAWTGAGQLVEWTLGEGWHRKVQEGEGEATLVTGDKPVTWVSVGDTVTSTPAHPALLWL